MSEQLRVGFEVFVLEEGRCQCYEHPAQLLGRNGSGDYAVTWVQGAWIGWQASREALVIELPEKWGEYTEVGSAVSDAIDECREAIEAAGLKVKP